MISTKGELDVDRQLLVSVGASFDVPAERPVALSLPRTLWMAWKAYGQRVATYQTDLLLSAVYFLVLGPSGLLARITGKQLLDLATTPRASTWLARPPAEKSVVSLQRQY